MATTVPINIPLYSKRHSSPSLWENSESQMNEHRYCVATWKMYERIMAYRIYTNCLIKSNLIEEQQQLFQDLSDNGRDTKESMEMSDEDKEKNTNYGAIFELEMD